MSKDDTLETTSTSITRLKLRIPRLADLKPIVDLKRQVPRLRDWNIGMESPDKLVLSTWNDKYLDYEIETIPIKNISQGDSATWNDKYLDYEIETNSNCLWPIEKCTWNDKYLDYEIETHFDTQGWRSCLELETTSTSITRLKLSYLTSTPRPLNLKRQVPRLRDWNC